jgi:hypothetical protein
METGTLLENVYATVGRGSLETEAYQKLDPPVDFSHCDKIGMVLLHAEEGPFAASLQLVTDANIVELGPEVCGLDRHTEERVDFLVPPALGNSAVRAMRVVFHRIPSQGGQSMKVDIRRFTLLPRDR